MANNPRLLKESEKPRKEKSHSGSWWQKKCDTLMQNISRARHRFCEVCGGKNEVGHHFITKTLSSFLRYEFKNLIPLCHSCHFAHHIKDDPNISATIIRKRGQEWHDWIESVRRKEIRTTIPYYKDIHERFTRLLEELH